MAKSTRAQTRLHKLIYTLIITAIAAIGSIAVGGLTAADAVAVEDAAYTAVTPCTAFDSRSSQGGAGVYEGPYDGDKVAGAFTGANKKTMKVTGTFPATQGGGNTDCGVPTGAAAVHINIIAVTPLTAGNVNVTDAGGTPLGGVVTYQVLAPSLNNSNASTIPLSAGGELDIYANCGANCSSPTIHVRGVILGYYTNDLATRVEALEVE